MRLCALLLLCACQASSSGSDESFVGSDEAAVKAADRKIIGEPAAYARIPAQKDRRAWAVQIVKHLTEGVPLADLPGQTLPRFSTWYARDDIERVFKRVYAGHGIDEALRWNPRSLDALASWSKERYAAYKQSLDKPDAIQGAAGIPRILYSPAFVRAFLERAESTVRCDATNAWGDPVIDAGPVHAQRQSGFIAELGKGVRAVTSPGLYDYIAGEAAPAAPCIGGELPADSVVIKADWRRAEFGETLPVYKERADRTEWNDPDHAADPGRDRIYTATLPNGNVFRLAGLHIMVKELHHWFWITLYWSENGNSELDGVWKNYAMCVVDSFENADGSPTLCSNPYLEHGPGNAATNCIGCHQHAGTALTSREILDTAEHRMRARNQFPSDYVWSIHSGDRLADIVKTELDVSGAQ